MGVRSTCSMPNCSRIAPPNEAMCPEHRDEKLLRAMKSQIERLSERCSRLEQHAQQTTSYFKRLDNRLGKHEQAIARLAIVTGKIQHVVFPPEGEEAK